MILEIYIEIFFAIIEKKVFLGFSNYHRKFSKIFLGNVSH